MELLKDTARHEVWGLAGAPTRRPGGVLWPQRGGLEWRSRFWHHPDLGSMATAILPGGEHFTPVLSFSEARVHHLQHRADTSTATGSLENPAPAPVW